MYSNVCMLVKQVRYSRGVCFLERDRGQELPQQQQTGWQRAKGILVFRKKNHWHSILNPKHFRIIPNRSIAIPFHLLDLFLSNALMGSNTKSCRRRNVHCSMLDSTKGSEPVNYEIDHNHPGTTPIMLLVNTTSAYEIMTGCWLASI